MCHRNEGKKQIVADTGLKGRKAPYAYDFFLTCVLPRPSFCAFSASDKPIRARRLQITVHRPWQTMNAGQPRVSQTQKLVSQTIHMTPEG